MIYFLPANTATEALLIAGRALINRPEFWCKEVNRIKGRLSVNGAMRKVGTPYPELPAEQLDALAGTPILLASEPYPFASKHCAQFASAGMRPMLVDGEAFSWYGSRMLHTVDYLKDMRQTLDQLPH